MNDDTTVEFPSKLMLFYLLGQSINKFPVFLFYQADIVYLSPPWGGPSYKNIPNFTLDILKPKDGYVYVACSRDPHFVADILYMLNFLVFHLCAGQVHIHEPDLSL